MRTKRKVPWLTQFFDNLANHVPRIPGKPMVFIFSFILLIMALTGPIFEFSDTWQLVFNTGATVITLLMMFVIQQTHNKHTMAIQLTLKELIACNGSASDRFIDIEDLTDDELQVVKKFYVRLAEPALKSNGLHSSHSLDDAQSYHETKSGYSNSRLKNPSKSTP